MSHTPGPWDGLFEDLDVFERLEGVIERLEGERDELLEAAKLAQDNIGWTTDAYQDQAVKEALQKAILRAERST